MQSAGGTKRKQRQAPRSVGGWPALSRSLTAEFIRLSPNKTAQGSERVEHQRVTHDEADLIQHGTSVGNWVFSTECSRQRGLAAQVTWYERRRRYGAYREGFALDALPSFNLYFAVYWIPVVIQFWLATRITCFYVMGVQHCSEAVNSSLPGVALH